MQKTFHFLLGVMVLQAVVNLPVGAETITEYTRIENDTVTFGNGTEDVIFDIHGADVMDAVNAGHVTIDAGTSGTISINGDAYGLFVATKNASPVDLETYSTIELNAGLIDINTANVALWAQNRTTNATNPNHAVSTINLTANQININSDVAGLIDEDGYYATIIAMSQGIVNITGNTKITSGGNIILARGDSQVNINPDADKIGQLDGNVVFNYKYESSNSPINAVVNIGLFGTDSYWNGNTMVAWDDIKPANNMLEVNEMTLTLKGGAVWNASQIEDFDVDYGTNKNLGQYYTALNNLNIDNGTVNIADTTRGITVENANIKDASFNGGMLNVGVLNLVGGTNTFNNDVLGIDADSVLTIADGAIMNIGTNAINIDTINLNGQLLATLRNSDDAQITANTFDGSGTVNLVFDGAGTYHVFGNTIIGGDANNNSNIVMDSSVYDLVWNGGDVTATLKSIDDIVADTGLSEDSAQTFTNMTASSSDVLNDMALTAQEHLASGDTAAVEHAHAAIHPETESVVQSVSVAVHNTVSNLVAGRLALPTTGRSGGDMQTSDRIWVQGLYNKSKQNGAFDGYTRGIALGVDGTVNKIWTFGAGYSYAHSDMTGTARETDVDALSIFAYAQYKPKAWYVNAILNYTMADYTEKGSALGVNVKSDFDVNSFGGTLTTGYDFAGGITPEFGLRYMHVSADSYKNSLGIAVDMGDTDYLTAILGTRYTFGFPIINKNLTLHPELNYAIKYDLLSDKQVATVVLPGIDAYVMDGARLSRLAGEIGAGIGLKYFGLDLSLNYNIEIREGYTSQTGRVKFRYEF